MHVFMLILIERAFKNAAVSDSDPVELFKGRHVKKEITLAKKRVRELLETDTAKPGEQVS